MEESSSLGDSQQHFEFPHLGRDDSMVDDATDGGVRRRTFGAVVAEVLESASASHRHGVQSKSLVLQNNASVRPHPMAMSCNDSAPCAMEIDSVSLPASSSSTATVSSSSSAPSSYPLRQQPGSSLSAPSVRQQRAKEEFLVAADTEQMMTDAIAELPIDPTPRQHASLIEAQQATDASFALLQAPDVEVQQTAALLRDVRSRLATILRAKKEMAQVRQESTVRLAQTQLQNEEARRTCAVAHAQVDQARQHVSSQESMKQQYAFLEAQQARQAAILRAQQAKPSAFTQAQLKQHTSLSHDDLMLQAALMQSYQGQAGVPHAGLQQQTLQQAAMLYAQQHAQPSVSSEAQMQHKANLVREQRARRAALARQAQQRSSSSSSRSRSQLPPQASSADAQVAQQAQLSAYAQTQAQLLHAQRVRVHHRQQSTSTSPSSHGQLAHQRAQHAQQSEQARLLHAQQVQRAQELLRAQREEQLQAQQDQQGQQLLRAQRAQQAATLHAQRERQAQHQLRVQREQQEQALRAQQEQALRAQQNEAFRTQHVQQRAALSAQHAQQAAALRAQSSAQPMQLDLVSRHRPPVRQHQLSLGQPQVSTAELLARHEARSNANIAMFVASQNAHVRRQSLGQVSGSHQTLNTATVSANQAPIYGGAPSSQASALRLSGGSDPQAHLNDEQFFELMNSQGGNR